MSKVIIREYMETDWQRLMEIHDAARKTELHLAGLDTAFIQLEEAAVNEGLFEYEVRVACVDGRVVGFVAYTEDELAWIYVDPACHRQGIGKAMVAYVIEHTTERPLYIEVLVGNEPALKLYESMGFTWKETASGDMVGNETFHIQAHVLQLV